jgi:hypothetical protein
MPLKKGSSRKTIVRTSREKKGGEATETGRGDRSEKGGQEQKVKTLEVMQRAGHAPQELRRWRRHTRHTRAVIREKSEDQPRPA